MYGRPAGSTSTPTLGTPQQRARTDALKSATHSSRQRQITALFAGGTANRLLLSLRSGIPQETDYALELLAQYSHSDAHLIPIESLGGLPSALLDFIRPSLARDSETRRRRLEAGLILRNLVLQGGQRCVEATRPCTASIFQILVECLQQRHADGNGEENAELELYLLDVAEVYAPRYTLQAPTTASSSNLAGQQPLFALLAKLAQSDDRALVIAAYTLLGALAMNEANEPFFAAGSTQSSVLLAQRALLLLPVNDSDLLLPLLEFLYQHTLFPANTPSILLRSDLRDVLRLLASRIREGGTEETVEWEVKLSKLRGKTIREAYMRTYPSLAAQAAQDTSRSSGEPPEAKLEGEALQRVLFLQEPERAKAWLHSVFEAHPAGEITQVNLWKAYQGQFDPFDAQMKAGAIPAMLNASEVIRTSSEAFPQAQPKMVADSSVAGGKRFVIAGIRIRHRLSDAVSQAVRDRWRCKWQGCPLPPVHFDTPGELYEHFTTSHALDTTSFCQYPACGHSVRSAREMLFHLRTHIVPSAPASTTGPSAMVHAADALDRQSRMFIDQRVHAQTTDTGYAVGIGFVSSLVLRNLARGIASAAERYQGRQEELEGDRRRDARRRHYARDSGGNSFMEEQDERMLGFLSGRQVQAANGPVQNQYQQEISLSDAGLRKACNALIAVEGEVITLAACNRPLATYLMETLECMEVAKRAVDGSL